VLSVPAVASPKSLFSLCCRGHGRTFAGMDPSGFSALIRVKPIRVPLWNWHGFTFPSNHARVSAAQFNRVYPSRRRTTSLNNAAPFLRRHDGYTAKG
jgi:hypothetical protein